MNDLSESRLRALRVKFIFNGVLSAIMISMATLVVLGFFLPKLSDLKVLLIAILNAPFGVIGGIANFNHWKYINHIH